MRGLVYVFLRKDGAPIPTGWAGHVGWGIQLANGSFYCGSTENQAGNVEVPAGGDNGAWAVAVADEAEMLEAMRQRNYDGYKIATVRNFDAAAGKQVAAETLSKGYLGIWNNCLDHTWQVLKAYGVKDLPWLQTHPAPNDWFALFNGEYRNFY